MKKQRQTKQPLFILGEILTIGGIDYCNGYAIAPDVQYLLDYKREVLGCGHLRSGLSSARMLGCCGMVMLLKQSHHVC